MAHSYERTDVRRRQIAQAALEIIADRGLRDFTTRAVAERVGITDGTVFRHFKNKAEIVLAALDSLEDQMFAGAEANIADPLDRLRAIFSARTRLVGGANSVGRLVFSDQIVHAAGAEGRAKIAGWRVRNLGLLTGCLEALAAEGRLRDGLTPTPLVLVVQGLILTTFVDRSLSASPPASLDAHVEGLWRTIEALILPPH